VRRDTAARLGSLSANTALAAPRLPEGAAFLEGLALEEQPRAGLRVGRLAGEDGRD
jgi:hypothetical protein